MKFDKFLRWSIKIAAVVLTAPATWQVAGRIYDDPLLRVLVQISCLMLVEGILLLGWHKLDDGRIETPLRWQYAILTSVAYAVLWVVAIMHGEGIAGVAFRATLGVAVGSSIVESGILASLRLQKRVDRDITQHRKVRKYKETAEIKVAQLEVDRWRREREDELRKGEELTAKKRQREYQKGLQEIGAADSEKATPKRDNSYPNLTYPIGQINSRRRLKKRQRIELVQEISKSNPELSATQVVDAIVKSAGVSESTAWSDWGAAKEAAPGYAGGNGHKSE